MICRNSVFLYSARSPRRIASVELQLLCELTKLLRRLRGGWHASAGIFFLTSQRIASRPPRGTLRRPPGNCLLRYVVTAPSELYYERDESVVVQYRRALNFGSVESYRARDTHLATRSHARLYLLRLHESPQLKRIKNVIKKFIIQDQSTEVAIDPVRILSSSTVRLQTVDTLNRVPPY